MKKQSISWKGDTITIQYGNGDSFVGNCADLPEKVYVSCEAARHGIGQKLGDAKSGGTAAQKFAEVKAIWAGLLGGDWNRRGETGLEIILRAYQIIANGLGKTDDQAAAWFQEYDEADAERREEIRAKPHMKQAIAAARLERNLPEGDESDFDPNA